MRGEVGGKPLVRRVGFDKQSFKRNMAEDFLLPCFAFVSEIAGE